MIDTAAQQTLTFLQSPMKEKGILTNSSYWQGKLLTRGSYWLRLVLLGWLYMDFMTCVCTAAY